MYRSKQVILGGAFSTMAALSTAAYAQTPAGPARDRIGDKAPDMTAVADCSRPDDAKEAKVVELDTGKSFAKLAVNLGSGRFKLVRITVWDRPEDPRPLIPVIEAARITQGLVQFYTPTLNNDPESAHESFLLMADMGGGNICWATPASLIKDVGQTVTEGKPPTARSTPDPTSPAVPEPRTESTTPPVSATTRPQTLESTPAPEVARSRSRVRVPTSPQ
jgi:hypothetical protein